MYMYMYMYIHIYTYIYLQLHMGLYEWKHVVFHNFSPIHFVGFHHSALRWVVSSEKVAAGTCGGHATTCFLSIWIGIVSVLSAPNHKHPISPEKTYKPSKLGGLWHWLYRIPNYFDVKSGVFLGFCFDGLKILRLSMRLSRAKRQPQIAVSMWEFP